MSQHRQYVGLWSALQASSEEEMNPSGLAIPWSFQRNQKCHLQGRKKEGGGEWASKDAGDHTVWSG